MSDFERYVGIDYSGAETPTSSLGGLRVFVATRASEPVEVCPPPSPRKYWTRRGVAEWIVARLHETAPTIFGIDHGFSFPLKYFEFHRLPLDWDAFLEDFEEHWPTHGDDVYVEFVREGRVGNGRARSGDARWRRLTEMRARNAKSVFHFDVQGSVAKATHAGLPWLRHIRRAAGTRAHFWPFDGWTIPEGASVVAEVYPSLWRQTFGGAGRNQHQQDAYTVAAWLRQADATGDLMSNLNPPMTDAERATASVEGWILGVMAATDTRARPGHSERTQAATTLTDVRSVPAAFPPGVAEKLRTYVYRLIDPRNGETFYVGKGRDNRLFAHIRLEAALEGDDLDNKAKRIREIHALGLEVGHVIHRHGMDDPTAFEVEAALIDAYPGLTNIASGAGSDYGSMHAREITLRYAAEPAVFRHRALLISVNRTAPETPLYDAVRYAWKINKTKALQAEVILATTRGLIIGAFVAHEWLEATAEHFPEFEPVPGRLGFVGERAPEPLAALYVGKRVPDEYRKRGAANPIKYTWE